MRMRKMLYVAVATAVSLGVGGAQAVDGGGTVAPFATFAGTWKCHVTQYPFEKIDWDGAGTLTMQPKQPEGQFCMWLFFSDPDFGFLERPYCGRYFPESLTMYKGRLGFTYAYGTFGGMPPVDYYIEGGEGTGNHGIGGSETGQLKLTEDARTGLLKLDGKSWMYIDAGDGAATAECDWKFKETPPPG